MNVLCKILPALEDLNKSKIVASNLRSMHEARKAIIRKKISCALHPNIMLYKNAGFVTGANAYYKKNKSKRQKGPGKFIGADNYQTLSKCGSFYC